MASSKVNTVFGILGGLVSTIFIYWPISFVVGSAVGIVCLIFDCQLENLLNPYVLTAMMGVSIIPLSILVGGLVRNSITG